MKIDELLAEVRELRSKGGKVVDIDRLESALSSAAASKTNEDEWKLKLAELKHQSDLAGYVATQESNRVLLEAVMGFASATLKSALLINGGAAVAILAYLGNARSEMRSEFPHALLMFTSGVLFAAVASGASYLAQYQYAKREAKAERWGDGYRGVAIGLVFLTYIAFAFGSYNAYIGFI